MKTQPIDNIYSYEYKMYVFKLIYIFISLHNIYNNRNIFHYSLVYT